MKTFISYIIVILVSQFMLTLGVMIVGLLSSFLFHFLPAKLRSFLSASIGSIAGVILSVTFGFWIFYFITGKGNYDLLPFLSIVIPILIPIRIDYKKYMQLKHTDNIDTLKNASSYFSDSVDSTIIASRAMFIGEIVGIISVFLWFFTFIN